MSNIMARPHVTDDEFDRMKKREIVWYRRHQAAWDLAAKLGEVTQESYEQAFDLLNSCKNLAVGLMRCDERENENNWKWINRKRDKLIKRMERLNELLKPYGCHIHRGWCCENVYDWDFDSNTPKNDHGYLYFF